VGLGVSLPPQPCRGPSGHGHPQSQLGFRFPIFSAAPEAHRDGTSGTANPFFAQGLDALGRLSAESNSATTERPTAGLQCPNSATRPQYVSPTPSSSTWSTRSPAWTSWFRIPRAREVVVVEDFLSQVSDALLRPCGILLDCRPIWPKADSSIAARRFGGQRAVRRCMLWTIGTAHDD
jgi:hypothetical protein